VKKMAGKAMESSKKWIRTTVHSSPEKTVAVEKKGRRSILRVGRFDFKEAM